MRKLAKYLKPYLPGIMLTFALLFGQAIMELNLPNLMADIVNIGLQQSGIEHAAPEAISPESLAKMTAHIPEADRQYVYEHYIEVSAWSTGRRTGAVIYQFPGMGETVYVRWYAPKEALGKLNEIFSQAAAALTGNNHAGIMLARSFYEELGADIESKQNRYIIRTGLFMLLFALLAGMATVGVGYLAPRISAGSARDLRKDLFAKVESFSQREFDTLSSASLITRCTNDVGQVQMFVGMGLRMLCSAPIMAIGGIIMAVNKSLSMSWIIALAVIILLGLAVTIITVALPKFKAIQKLIDRLTKVSREILGGLMVIRAFGTQKHEIKRFDAANRELTDVNLYVGRIMAVVNPAITFLMSGTALLIVWVGSGQIADSHLQIGDMMAFMQYAMQVIMSFMMISFMLFFIPRAAVSAERIAEVMETPLTVVDPKQPENFDAKKTGTVEFKHVSFRYQNAEEDALSDISFTAQPGQTTAFIGATGSGKSTLANLLLRFYDVTGGGIYVNGTDIRQVRQEDLRACIGYVPQKGQLLKGTVASNIGYGGITQLSLDEVAEAAETAQAAEFINEKEEKYGFEISQKAANISGGQKQRIAIARALAKKPAILVFDDSFSALDFQTDAKLRRALKETAGRTTMIVIAQRVGTIMNAEQIIVLDEGKVVGKGTHGELLETCPEYAEIASSQLHLSGGAANGKG
jgi:ATP-binding cassette subfamily B protein